MINKRKGAGEMAQWGEVTAVKTDDLGLIPGNHIIGEKIQCLQVILYLHTALLRPLINE